MMSPGVARVASRMPHVLAAFAHRRLELVGDVEMLDDRGLAAPGDEDHLLDPRLARLVHRILDQRPVDDRQHLLGDRLGRGKEARAEPGDRENGFLDRFAAAHQGAGYEGPGEGVNRQAIPAPCSVRHSG